VIPVVPLQRLSVSSRCVWVCDPVCGCVWVGAMPRLASISLSLSVYPCAPYTCPLSVSILSAR
jgi:hypothetical protein